MTLMGVLGSLNQHLIYFKIFQPLSKKLEEKKVVFNAHITTEKEFRKLLKKSMSARTYPANWEGKNLGRNLILLILVVLWGKLQKARFVQHFS